MACHISLLARPLWKELGETSIGGTFIARQKPLIAMAIYGQKIVRFFLPIAITVGAILFGGGLLIGAGEIARVEASKVSTGLINNLNSLQSNTIDNLSSVVDKLTSLGHTVDINKKLIKLLAGHRN